MNLTVASPGLQVLRLRMRWGIVKDSQGLFFFFFPSCLLVTAQGWGFGSRAYKQGLGCKGF